MLLKETNPKHVFYHADRAASLQEGKEIELNENNLSYFGNTYWPFFKSTRVEDMSPEHQREFYLEEIKKEHKYSLYSSRLQSIFAANTIADAVIFANSIVPKPNHPIPIIEIFADRFWTLDSNWLDYVGDRSRQLECYRYYWEGIISNHCPKEGERRPPRLEALIALPATAGKIVHIVE